MLLAAAFVLGAAARLLLEWAEVPSRSPAHAPATDEPGWLDAPAT